MNKKKFLSNEFWTLSWSASVQRALKYNKSQSADERAAFRNYIITFCEDSILPDYKKKQSEEAHLEAIERIQNHASQYPNKNLLIEPYNIGISQKLLNLQIKYLWCAGMVEIPPHCPVDRIILGFTELKNKLNWTQMKKMSEYMDAISAIKKKAGDISIAEWELQTYARPFQKSQIEPDVTNINNHH